MANRDTWDWSEEEIKRMGYRVVDLIADHLCHLAEGPVFRPFPTEWTERYLHSDVPQAGAPWEEILETFASEISPFPFGNGHPRFFVG
jgi:aromatic-L-amino-acid decarboxylase